MEGTAQLPALNVLDSHVTKLCSNHLSDCYFWLLQKWQWFVPMTSQNTLDLCDNEPSVKSWFSVQFSDQSFVASNQCFITQR